MNNITNKISATFAAFLLAGNVAANATEQACSSSPGRAVSIIRAESEGAPGGPEIRISAAGRLEVRLVSNGDASIDLSTLKIQYKLWNITNKIAAAVGELSETIDVANELLPLGTYGISIRVADSQGRNTKTKLKLQVIEVGIADGNCQDGFLPLQASATPKQSIQS